MNGKIEEFETIENDKYGFCLVNSPTNSDVEDENFRSICGRLISVKLKNGNLRKMKDFNSCTCLKCLKDFKGSDK